MCSSQGAIVCTVVPGRKPPSGPSHGHAGPSFPLLSHSSPTLYQSGSSSPDPIRPSVGDSSDGRLPGLLALLFRVRAVLPVSPSCRKGDSVFPSSPCRSPTPDMPDTSLMLATTGDSSPPPPSKSAMRIAEGRNGLLFPLVLGELVSPLVVRREGTGVPCCGVIMGLFKRPGVGGVPSAVDVECAAAKVDMIGVIRGDVYTSCGSGVGLAATAAGTL